MICYKFSSPLCLKKMTISLFYRSFFIFTSQEPEKVSSASSKWASAPSLLPIPHCTAIITLIITTELHKNLHVAVQIDMKTNNVIHVRIERSAWA